MASTTGAYRSISLFLFLDASNYLFFLDCLDISSQDSWPVRKNAGWKYSIFNNAPPIRATRNEHMGCWKARTHVIAWKSYRDSVFIQDKQPVLSPSNISDKRRASSDISPVSSHNRTAMCNIFQNTKKFHIIYNYWFWFCTQPATAPKKSKNGPVAPLTSSDSSVDEENDDLDDEDGLRLMVWYHFFFVSWTQWVIRFVVSCRNHLFSGRADMSSRPRPRTRRLR